MKILVTGGAGFIGSHLVEALLARGDQVVVLDSLDTGKLEFLPRRPDGTHLTFVEGDVRDEALLGQVFGDHRLDGVLHQAARSSVPKSVEDPQGFLEVNTIGTAVVLEASRASGVKKFVFASSASVYGDGSQVPARESDLPAPASPYAVSKLAAERLVCSYADLHGMETVALRYFNIFGPRQDPGSPYAAAIPLFLAAFHRSEAPTIFGDGEQTRDFTYVGDAVQANLRSLEAPGQAWGGVFNVGCGERISVNRLAALLRSHTGGPEPVHGPERPGDVRDSQASIELARSVLGYRPEVSLEEGLRRTAEAFAL